MKKLKWRNKTLTFSEMVDLKGRNGSRDSLTFKVSRWAAKKVLTALANEPQCRKELAAILRVAELERKGKP